MSQAVKAKAAHHSVPEFHEDNVADPAKSTGQAGGLRSARAEFSGIVPARPRKGNVNRWAYSTFVKEIERRMS